MCKDIYRITKGGTDAWTLQHEAAKLGITVRYRTAPKNGLIRGVSFERISCPVIRKTHKYA